jgi:putative serine protease PepD
MLLPGVAVLAVSAAVAGCTSSASTSGGSTTSAGTAEALQAHYEGVIKAVLPSVVQILTTNSTGSGVVYDSNGDIVTNAHVVGDAKTVNVLPAAGAQQLPATVVGVFKPDDLAVVRVSQDADQLKVATFGNSDDADVGEIVLAMGNPLGLFDSVTQGIVSATGRTVTEGSQGGAPLITAAIQTSAAINPGNSGGALVDLNNQVLGIPTLTARLPEAGGIAPGIGFAIPSNTVRNIADQLISTGKVTRSDRATLGISAQTSANAAGEGVGVAIRDAPSGGAAAKAGLKAGDLIVGVNNQSTPTVQVLESYLATLRPGDQVTVHVQHNGSKTTATVTLGSLSS